MPKFAGRRATFSRLRTRPLPLSLLPVSRVYAWKGETEEEYEWCLEQTILKDGAPWDANMILDDGGDLTELLHKKYPAILDRVHGVTEETTTGVHRLLDMLAKGELKIPAINVNDSVTKSKNDNKYGCRHSLNDAIKRGTDHLLSGKQALVIGYGDVGKGSAQSLRQEGMIVKVSEVDPICAMQACMDGFELVSPFIDGINTGTEASIDKALLGKIDLIVTTTGNVNVCDSNMLKALKKRAVVCNIGHFDNEIDTAFMRKNWAWEEVKPQVHKIHRTGPGAFDAQNDDYLILLAEGRLVNLGNATGHPSRIMDGSFANQVLAQIFLFGQKYADLSPAQKAERLTVESTAEETRRRSGPGNGSRFRRRCDSTDQDPGRLHRRDRRRPVQAARLPLLIGPAACSPLVGAGFCGSWLACDGITSVFLKHRGAGIAGKPGAHTSLLPFGLSKPHRLTRFQGYDHVPRPSLQFRVLPYQDRCWA